MIQNFMWFHPKTFSKYYVLYAMLGMSQISHAGALPASLYTISLDQPISTIVKAKKTFMSGMYYIDPVPQMDEPLNVLLVKVDSNSSKIKNVSAEVAIDISICNTELMRLKAKYESLYKVSFGVHDSGQGYLFHMVEDKNTILLIGCVNENKMKLRVVLARK